MRALTPPIPDAPPDAPRRYDLVICDVDGCLSPESAGPFDLGALAKIRRHNDLAYERGDRPVVTPCTGRPLPFAEAMARLLGNRSVPLIAENGAWMYWPTANTYDRDPRTTREHIHLIHELSEWIEKTYGPRGVVQQPGKSASVSLYHHDTQILHDIVDEIRGEVGERAWPLRVSMTWLYINIDLAFIDKGTAIDRLVEALDLEDARDRLAGVGDTQSDLAIRDRVAWFACPANAKDEVKARADFIASQNEAAGIAEILERLAGQNS